MRLLAILKCWWDHDRWIGKMPMFPLGYAPTANECVWINGLIDEWILNEPHCVCGHHNFKAKET